MGLFKRKKEIRFPYGIALLGKRGGGIRKDINECFTLQKKSNFPYEYVIQIIASRERIFPLFLSLSSYVGDPCMTILEARHDPEYPVVYSSKSHSIEDALKLFKEYSFQLVNDGFTGFGLASDQFEVFLDDYKVIQVFCNSKDIIIKEMDKFEIARIKQIKQLISGPHSHFPINTIFSEDYSSEFEPLPNDEIERFKSDPQTYSNFFDNIVKELHMEIEGKV